MKAGSIQQFELDNFLLQYDFSSEVLLCKSATEHRKLWIKKIEEGGSILDVIGSGDLFFIAFEYGETGGQFLAVNKSDGKTRWFIPGRAYMYRIFGPHIFLIFIDGESRYYFIKSSMEDGGMLWHHPVNMGLESYSIKKDYVTLVYDNGSKEVLDMTSGEEVS